MLIEDIHLQFIVTSYVGIVEWWITNGMPYPPHVLAEQVGILLERNYSYLLRKTFLNLVKKIRR
jgi:hypothetical protein